MVEIINHSYGLANKQTTPNYDVVERVGYVSVRRDQEQNEAMTVCSIAPIANIPAVCVPKKHTLVFQPAGKSTDSILLFYALAASGAETPFTIYYHHALLCSPYGSCIQSASWEQIPPTGHDKLGLFCQNTHTHLYK